MRKIESYSESFSDVQWAATAAFLSGENLEDTGDGNTVIIPEKEMPLTCEMWKKSAGLAGEEEITPTGEAWNRLYNRLVESGEAGRAKKLFSLNGANRIALGIAASFLLIATTAYLVWRIASPSTEKTVTVASGGERNTRVLLPDGSQVTLNRNSSVTYPYRFSDDLREVILSGEAFFEVVHNEAIPFRVAAGNASVEVIGTSFSVSTHTPSVVEVFVSTGMVRLMPGGNDAGVVLTEGQIGTITGGITRSYQNDNPNYLSWQSGVLRYEGASLATVFGDLNRVYGTEVSADSSLAAGKMITTTFDNLDEEEIIRIISATFQLSWRKEGRVYVFSQQ